MQYFKNAEGKYEPLRQKNVDTGMGLDRTLCILNGVKSVYDTDLFETAKAKIEELTGKKYDGDGEVKRAFRIILDHVRTATFMIGDPKGITPPTWIRAMCSAASSAARCVSAGTSRSRRARSAK